MTNQHQLKSNHTLNNFITNQHINTFISFPPKKEFSADFINWLSPKYFETFKLIYQKHIGTETQIKVTKLLSAPWYCNAETEDRIIDLLTPHLNETLEISKTLKSKFETKGQDFETIVKYSPLLIKQVLNPLNQVILRHDHERITTFKNKIIDHCLAISEILKCYKESDIEFTFSNAILERLKDFNFNRMQQQRFKACIRNSGTVFKATKVISAVIFFVVLLRIITVFAQF